MDRPQVTVISPDAGRLKDKHFVIKNLSRMTVLHAFGDTVANVDPGQLIGYRRQPARLCVVSSGSEIREATKDHL